jgi:hypothetical protein
MNYGIVFIWVFFAVALAFLNKGPKDNQEISGEKYWAKYNPQ